MPPPSTPILRVRLCMEIKKKLAYLIILILSSPFFSASHVLFSGVSRNFPSIIITGISVGVRLSFFFQSLETSFFFCVQFLSDSHYRRSYTIDYISSVYSYWFLAPFSAVSRNFLSSRGCWCWFARGAGVTVEVFFTHTCMSLI